MTQLPDASPPPQAPPSSPSKPHLWNTLRWTFNLSFENVFLQPCVPWSNIWQWPGSKAPSAQLPTGMSARAGAGGGALERLSLPAAAPTKKTLSIKIQYFSKYKYTKTTITFHCMLSIDSRLFVNLENCRKKSWQNQENSNCSNCSHDPWIGDRKRNVCF